MTRLTQSSAAAPPAALAMADDHRAPARQELCFVVDDEPGIVGHVAAILSDFGIYAERFEVLGATIDALAARDPALLFIDPWLGEANAVDALRRIAQRRPAGAVQVMSRRDALGNSEIRRFGIEQGLRMLPPVQKPLRRQDVREVVVQAGLEVAAAFSGPPIQLSEALRKGWLDLWYQPKVDLRTRRLAGAEGLIRLRHPDHGIVLPDAFLPAARDAALLSLTKYVLALALRDSHLFAGAGVPLRLAMNVPACALAGLPFAAILRELASVDSGGSGLILEIPLPAAMQQPQLVREIARDLRVFNVGLAVDDVGPQYRVLAGFDKPPFCEVKIDRGVAANCHEDPSSAEMVADIVRLARRGGAKTVAEGIERPETLEALARLGCDLGQGFLFARAMPKDRLIAAALRRREAAQAGAVAEL